MSNFGDGAIAVIGHRFDHHCNAVGAVSLVGHLVVVRSFAFPHAALYRPVDRVVGHVLRLCVRNGFAKPRVRVHIAAPAGAGRDGDLFDHLRKDLAALGIESALFVLNCVPLTVS